MSRPVSPRCCRWWGRRGRERNPVKMCWSLTIKNVVKLDLKYLKGDYFSVLLSYGREYVVRVWAHIGCKHSFIISFIVNCNFLSIKTETFIVTLWLHNQCNFMFHKSILTVVIFRIKREEFWENIVEQLLCDETTRALRLENSVEPLHLGFAKSKMR